MAKQNAEPGQRTQADYLAMTHSIAINHLQTELKKSVRKPRYVRITEYLTTRWVAWLYYYVVNRFGRNHPFRAYPKSISGVYPLGTGATTICLAADWATDTPESAAIAKSMGELNPDYTIHLGDTYYVGAPHEIGVNFTWKNSPWVRGSKGSFALIGNHEMYARGIAYYKELLPTLGPVINGKSSGQHAGYFCLENEHWRILGLDTGYHSIGKIPLLEMLPWFAPDCHFDPVMMDWLKKEVKLDDPNDKRGLIIFTHHQYISAFKEEAEYIKPAEQLAELIGKHRTVLWLFGHEHKFSIYEKVQVGEGITAYGRCVGHGGMPIEIDSKSFEADPQKYGFGKLVMVDQRDRAVDFPGRIGFNGFVHLSLLENVLTVNYRDVKNLLLTETWAANNKTGEIKGGIEVHDNAIQPREGKTWNDAVK